MLPFNCCTVCKTQLIFCFATFIFYLFSNSSVKGQIFEGKACTSGGYVNVQGECRQFSDCPAALSNFRSGITPPLCYQENGVPYICCQVGKRISAKKCDLYAKQLATIQSSGTPFFTLNAGGSNDGSEDPSRFVNGLRLGNCTATNNMALISGGRPADRDEMSFTVALGYDDHATNGIAWKCGGTLISPDFVLTAAHCIDGKATSAPTRVLIGDKHLEKLDSFSSQKRVEAYVKEIFIHPEYKRPIKYNDIGLLKLDRQVNFSRMVYPACLPQPENRPDSNNDFLTAGWGRLEYFGRRGDVLQVVDITRFRLKECSNVYSVSTELPEGISKSQICAGDATGNKDSCDGDSGGPLSARPDKENCMHTIYGVTSFGDKFCGTGTPAVYTNVQSYLDWIEGIVWETELYNI